jgi:alkylation response protein AidB-like acyl-CoA dehydrogenase
MGIELIARLRCMAKGEMPLPGGGQTALRHRRLMDIGRESLPLARLAEGHWDAVAILAEARRKPELGAIYGVWASELPGHELQLESGFDGFRMSGTKRFCSGAGLVDRALLTTGAPQKILIDLDLRKNAEAIHVDHSAWKSDVFRETGTATITFDSVPISAEQIIGGPGWYLDRLGFWYGACGPAACWAGGAQGLVAYASEQSREDPHTLAHLGAMQASVWALRTYLDSAGCEIDGAGDTPTKARILALTVRHLVEQACTDVLRRLTRAYGPHPLALNEDISRRYQELDLYLRQSHAERDLEALGRDFKGHEARYPAAHRHLPEVGRTELLRRVVASEVRIDGGECSDPEKPTVIA